MTSITHLETPETHPPTSQRQRTAKLRKPTNDVESASAAANKQAHRQLFAQCIIRPTKMLLLSSVSFGLLLSTATAYGILCLLFTTIDVIFIKSYDFVSNVGLVYLPIGIGQIVGLLVFGAISDKILKRCACGGEMKLEYRLPPMLPGAAMLLARLLLYIDKWVKMAGLSQDERHICS